MFLIIFKYNQCKTSRSKEIWSQNIPCVAAAAHLNIRIFNNSLNPLDISGDQYLETVTRHCISLQCLVTQRPALRSSLGFKKTTWRKSIWFLNVLVIPGIQHLKKATRRWKNLLYVKRSSVSYDTLWILLVHHQHMKHSTTLLPSSQCLAKYQVLSAFEEVYKTMTRITTSKDALLLKILYECC